MAELPFEPPGKVVLREPARMIVASLIATLWPACPLQSRRGLPVSFVDGHDAAAFPAVEQVSRKLADVPCARMLEHHPAKVRKQEQKIRTRLPIRHSSAGGHLLLSETRCSPFLAWSPRRVAGGLPTMFVGSACDVAASRAARQPLDDTSSQAPLRDWPPPYRPDSASPGVPCSPSDRPWCFLPTPLEPHRRQGCGEQCEKPACQSSSDRRLEATTQTPDDH